jgi:colicin import membrane protein
MQGALRENSWPVVGSVAVHALLAAAIVLASLVTADKRLPELHPLPIDAVVVDARVLQAAQRAQAERAEDALARARAAAEAKAAAEQKDAEAEQNRAAAAEQEQADVRREAEERKRLEDRQAMEEAKRAEQARSAAQAKRVAEENKAAEEKQAAEAKRAADERAKREREAELKRQLADEEHTSAVAAGPLRDRYITLLRNRIQNAWIKPPSATAGVDCLVEVTQVPGGEVTGARVTQCNGDAAVRQSIENAVYRASPLPDPPDPALFERNLVLRFRPNE